MKSFSLLLLSFLISITSFASEPKRQAGKCSLIGSEKFEKGIEKLDKEIVRMIKEGSFTGMAAYMLMNEFMVSQNTMSLPELLPKLQSAKPGKNVWMAFRVAMNLESMANLTKGDSHKLSIEDLKSLDNRESGSVKAKDGVAKEEILEMSITSEKASEIVRLLKEKNTPFESLEVLNEKKDSISYDEIRSLVIRYIKVNPDNVFGKAMENGQMEVSLELSLTALYRSMNPKDRKLHGEYLMSLIQVEKRVLSLADAELNSKLVH